VLSFSDELSEGPIESDDVQARMEWWDSIVDWPERGEAISAFWCDIETGPPLVVWFGRGDARDLCLYFALCERCPDRITAIGDVSTISVQYEWPDGTTVSIPPPHNLNSISGNILSLLTALTVPPDPTEIVACSKRWRELKAENAPFRVVDDGALISQPATYFDTAILGAADKDWRRTVGVIARALNDCSRKSHHVSDYVLLSRVVALVGSGALEGEGDPWLMHESRVRHARTD
jgi:hypothetical protein